MSAEQNKAFIRRYFQVLIDKPKTEEVLRQFIDDASLLEHIAGAEAAFPGYRLESQDMIAEGDRVVVRFTGGGTHQGEFFGIAPTGRDVRFDGIIIYRIANGKIVDHWMQMDVPSLMQQLAGGAAAVA